MRLGGSVAAPFVTAEQWGKSIQKARYAATSCPVAHDAPDRTVAAVTAEAKRRGVLIAEVGVWRNTLSPDSKEREASLTFAKNQLAFADEIGANCCVNIVGARGARWDGAYRDNYSEQAYSEIVRSIREIIDAVRPARTFYTIEPMPWMVPDGPDEYLRLVRDVDRERFAVHMDFVNMINSAKRVLFAEEFIEECFGKLGPMVKSCHIKDVLLEEPLTLMIREVPPGKGRLNFSRVLRFIDQYVSRDIPVLLEHIQTDSEYARAYDHLATIAKQEGIAINAEGTPWN